MPRPNLSYIDYRSGVMASGDSGSTTGTPTHMAMRVAPVANALSVTVEMGNAVINTPGQGAYMCALDSQKTLALAAASSTQNRVDLVVARVYDDLNTSISSPSGTRKFCVEVWQGDYSSGAPTTPTPTPTNGWTPLAAITVNKGATSLTAANIQDLRGPGLVARGGMRALYGADAKTGSPAFTEAGSYPGEQRWVHAPGFQHQVYYGSQTGWRGVSNCIFYYGAAPPGEYSFVGGFGVAREICRVTVADPGMPYFIYPSGKAAITLSANSAADLRITTGSLNGPVVFWSRFHTYGTSVDKLCVPNVAPTYFGPLTGSTDIVLSCGMRDSNNQYSGFGFRGNDAGANIVTSIVFPATAQPPAV
ncbi:hypothetical protein [Amycolatopsis dendrobii]|uniref:Uncharacterized protein n=1 Tax=Amycolatopsis dendrobii TaxID=2760662 RepID=A0A7W3VVR1_9PSEU|nr:hypothetical protein [Amycolatopsis dendrobii]MBB1153527.1 hypothetical protein [Amycolatopsis dendrobii]